MKPARLLLSLMLCGHALVASSAESSLADALQATRPTLDLRVRHESVDDDAFERDAEADTLRTRLGLKTGAWHGWNAFVEAEDIQALDDTRYNDTANGRTQYPVIADPESTELNQAWLAYTGARGAATLGRQRVVLDNQRHFGDVGFRQNQQTFDAAGGKLTLGKAVLQAIYLDKVHRIFGDDHPNRLLAEQDLSAPLLNVAWPAGPVQLVAFAYFVDNQDLPLTSARTLGLRASGQHATSETRSLGYAFEVARQDSWRDGSDAIDADYVSGELSWGSARHRGRVGYERLGGDGSYGFSTPFATLHAFNGWADRFLVTPLDGLVDAWAGVGGKLWRGDYAVVYHRFEADRGGQDYGDEWDASYRMPLGPKVELEVKAADYRADDFSSDVLKLWAAFTVRY